MKGNNGSQSSVTSNHKNSLMDESISGNTVVNMIQAVLPQQHKRQNSGSRTNAMHNGSQHRASERGQRSATRNV